MKYYFLLDNLNENVKTGIYGRRLPNEEEKKELTLKDLLPIFDLRDIKDEEAVWKKILIYSNLYTASAYFIRKSYNKYKKLSTHKPLCLIQETEEKCIIIPNKLLDGDYKIDDENRLMHGAFQNFPNNDLVFKTLLDSTVDSSLIIAEKSLIDKKHFGGTQGVFDTGLYCEHPKDNNILIPLDKTGELIKSLILEEIINVYEALGAKRIEINDLVDFILS